MRFKNATDSDIKLVLKSAVGGAVFGSTFLSSQKTAIFIQFKQVEILPSEPSEPFTFALVPVITPPSGGVPSGDPGGGTDPTELNDGGGDVLPQELVFVNRLDETLEFIVQGETPDVGTITKNLGTRILDVALVEIHQATDGKPSISVSETVEQVM